VAGGTHRSVIIFLKITAFMGTTGMKGMKGYLKENKKEKKCQKYCNIFIYIVFYVSFHFINFNVNSDFLNIIA